MITEPAMDESTPGSLVFTACAPKLALPKLGYALKF
jgi:hypothetical protein